MVYYSNYLVHRKQTFLSLDRSIQSLANPQLQSQLPGHPSRGELSHWGQTPLLLYFPTTVAGSDSVLEKTAGSGSFRGHLLVRKIPLPQHQSIDRHKTQQRSSVIHSAKRPCSVDHNESTKEHYSTFSSSLLSLVA